MDVSEGNTVQTCALNDRAGKEEEDSWRGTIALFGPVLKKLGTLYTFFFEDTLPSLFLPSFPSACTFRGFCLYASSSSTLNTAVPYAPSIKGQNLQESQGLVWTRA